MNPSTRKLFASFRDQEYATFTTRGRIDGRRYLSRTFPVDLPLLILPQDYPDYRALTGENWMHWHDYYEMLVMVRGHGELQCGMKCFDFGPGDVVLVDPLKLHGVSRLDEPHSSIVILFHRAAVAPTGASPDLGFLSTWDRRPETLVPKVSVDNPNAPVLHEALWRLLQAHNQEPSEEKSVALKFHFLEVLFHLRKCFPVCEVTPVEDSAMRLQRQTKLSRVLQHVSLHCHQPISQPSVALVAGMSPSSFRVFFKETTGWGFAEYLRRLRVDRAAHLLRETQKSVADVALATGFADQSHLNRCFKAEYGVTPLAYRSHQAAP